MSLPAPYYSESGITIYCGDCRTILPELERVDLVLADPPYGIRRDGQHQGTGSHGGRKAYAFKGWDDAAPDQKTFDLIFRASENQILWGANYYPAVLPPKMGWLVWDKGQRICGSDAELAFTSFDTALRVVELNRVELLMDGAVHPTQKPLKLMTWCIRHADKHGFVSSVIDPFMGSGTTLRAAKDLGRECIGIERDEEFCAIAVQRLRQEVLIAG